MPAIMPNRCATGRASRLTSSGPTSASRASVVAFQYRLPWVTMTPLGRPVVPPVYMITATSLSSRSTKANSGLASRVIASKDTAPSGTCSAGPVTTTVVGSGSPAMAADSPGYRSGLVTSTLGVESARMWLTSFGARTNTMGTTTPPIAMMPP